MITWQPDPDGPAPLPDDVDPEDIYSDPDDCQHTFHPVGMSDYGTVYECSKCGGLTP